MNKLKQHREAAGITQKQLAEKTQMSLRTIQHLEQGTRDLNKAQAFTVWSIAKALNCKMEDLIEAGE